MKEELIIAAASKVQEDWCTNELKGFFTRAQRVITLDNTDLITVLNMACYKNGQKRNEIIVDSDYISNNNLNANDVFSDFNVFMDFVNKGIITVKRFTKRDLTAEEIVVAKQNYKAETGEENILRPFLELSKASRKENLDAAIGAGNVYEQLSKAGISIEQMQNNPEMSKLIGIAIHADWLKRNINHPNESLKVSYDQLDEWTQQQDLVVFNALLEVVKQNGNKYTVAKVDGYQLPDYASEEIEVLKTIHVKSI